MSRIPLTHMNGKAGGIVDRHAKASGGASQVEYKVTLIR